MNHTQKVKINRPPSVLNINWPLSPPSSYTYLWQSWTHILCLSEKCITFPEVVHVKASLQTGSLACLCTFLFNQTEILEYTFRTAGAIWIWQEPCYRSSGGAKYLTHCGAAEKVRALCQHSGQHRRPGKAQGTPAAGNTRIEKDRGLLNLWTTIRNARDFWRFLQWKQFMITPHCVDCQTQVVEIVHLLRGKQTLSPAVGTVI